MPPHRLARMQTCRPAVCGAPSEDAVPRSPCPLAAAVVCRRFGRRGRVIGKEAANVFHAPREGGGYDSGYVGGRGEKKILVFRTNTI